MAPADYQKITAVIDTSVFPVFIFTVHLVADHAIVKTNAKGEHDVIELLHVIGCVFKNPFLLDDCIASGNQIGM